MVRKVNSERKNRGEANVKFRTINSIQPGDGLNEMKPRLQVMKFGGTSVGDAACIARTAQIIAAAAKESGCVAVVSAMSGVTNRLIEAAKKAQEGNAAGAAEVLDALRQQHEAALLILIPHEEKRARLRQQMEEVLAEGRRLCEGTALLRELTPRALGGFRGRGKGSPHRWWRRQSGNWGGRAKPSKRRS